MQSVVQLTVNGKMATLNKQAEGSGNRNSEQNHSRNPKRTKRVCHQSA